MPNTCVLSGGEGNPSNFIVPVMPNTCVLSGGEGNPSNFIVPVMPTVFQIWKNPTINSKYYPSIHGNIKNTTCRRLVFLVLSNFFKFLVTMCFR